MKKIASAALVASVTLSLFLLASCQSAGKAPAAAPAATPIEAAAPLKDPSLLAVRANDTKASVSISMDDSEERLGTVAQMGVESSPFIKSVDGKPFTIADLRLATLNEALDASGKSLATISNYFKVLPVALERYDSQGSAGVLDVNAFMETIGDADVEMDAGMPTAEVDAASIGKVRTLVSIIFTIKDSSNRRVPVQLYMDYTQEMPPPMEEQGYEDGGEGMDEYQGYDDSDDYLEYEESQEGYDSGEGSVEAP